MATDGKKDKKTEMPNQASKDADENKKQQYNWEIKKVPMDQIVEHKFLYKGVRDENQFKELVESIRKYGLLELIGVRKKDDKYELGMGHHRYIAVKELGWKDAKVKVFDIEDDMFWAEMVVEDNIKHTNYKPNQLEEQIYILWIKGHADGTYETFEDIGQRFGFSETWVRKLIEGRELRIKIKKKYRDVNLDNFSAETLIEAKKIIGDREDIGFNDYVALLELANKKNLKAGKIKEMAKTLNDWPKELRDKVLYEKESYDKIKFNLKHSANGTKPKPKNKKHTGSLVETDNPKFIIEIYEALNKHLKTYLPSLEGKEKGKAFRYIKMTTVLLCEQLLDHDWINEIHFKQISDEILGVNITPYNYDGGGDLQMLGKFIDSHAKNLENKRMNKVTSDDQQKPISDGED